MDLVEGGEVGELRCGTSEVFRSYSLFSDFIPRTRLC